MDLFDQKLNQNRPLADKLRPSDFDSFVGQEHLTGTNAPLRNMIENDDIPSMIFWGHPGRISGSNENQVSRSWRNSKFEIKDNCYFGLNQKIIKNNLGFPRLFFIKKSSPHIMLRGETVMDESNLLLLGCDYFSSSQSSCTALYWAGLDKSAPSSSAVSSRRRRSFSCWMCRERMVACRANWSPNEPNWWLRRPFF